MRDNAFLRIIRFFITFFTLLAAGTSILGYIGSHFGGIFQVFALYGLIQPILIILNSLFLIYWAFRFEFWFWLPLIALILNIGFIRSVYQLPGNAKTTEVTGDKSIRIGTFNVKGFYHGRRSLTVSMISEFMKEKEVDILCFQEVDLDSVYTLDSLAKAFNFLPYLSYSKSKVQGFNLLTLSKYPILKSSKVRFEKTGNQAMWTDLLIREDTVRIFNFHLQTTNFNQAKFSLVPENWVFKLSDEAERLMEVYQILKENFKKRIKQANFIHLKIKETPYSTLICGDMNSNPASHTYHQIKGRELKDGFITCGSGYEYTYKGLKSLYRIDYIFHTKDFAGKNYKSYLLDYSDHKAVIMELFLK
ncbi:MAG: endonuclease/exonuclease/phosphatase family protein [Bacteroidales bacterium]|nr:endonuclease/exonuclease/phosphatase family protein [Bacteroidales bacterium]